MDEFHEPWQLMSDRMDRMPIVSADGGHAIVHAAMDDHDYPMVAVKGDQQAKIWRRVVACVNACKGIPTRDLEDDDKSVVIVS